MPPRDPPWETKYSYQLPCEASYLASLRNNRPHRPTGSRPPPATFNSTNRLTRTERNTLSRSDSAPPEDNALRDIDDRGRIEEVSNLQSNVTKSTSLPSGLDRKSRPLAQPPNYGVPTVRGRKVSPTATIQTSAEFSDGAIMESTSRRLEKEEAQTLREALEIIDQRDVEKRLYDDAQREAADLVWKHRNPQAAEDEKRAPYRNPDLHKDARDRNSGTGESKVVNDGKWIGHNSRSASNDLSLHNSGQQVVPRDAGKRTSKVKDRVLSDALSQLELASAERAASIINTSNLPKNRRRSSGQRHVSNGSNRGLFRNPEDQIYEEPEQMRDHSHQRSQHSSTTPLRNRPQNYPSRFSNTFLEDENNLQSAEKPRLNRFEIHRNPPSQSRNAAYTTNGSLSASQMPADDDGETASTGSMEIRSDEIRAATSMRMKDRSPKLPTPTAVSDQPGRPVVSFDRNWRPSNGSPRGSQDHSTPVIRVMDSPVKSNSFERGSPTPSPSILPNQGSIAAIPTFNLTSADEGIPSINVQDESTPKNNKPTLTALPTISTPDEVNLSTQSTPRAALSSKPKQPSVKNSRIPWLNFGGRNGEPTVSCSSCSLPISGRIVTASGAEASSPKARFHPECFTCHHCSTALECVSFYPEPETNRLQRLEAEGIPSDSHDADLRFYCHLDFHEFFSPRCRSCKTPIEGEVIVAAGAEWHVGHFFCGECGEPFDSSTPFVEKDGYAYCVSCHTKRTSARCRECKKQILDEVSVEALGGKWHESCFACFECAGGFGEQGRFFVRDINVEPTDKEKRKGITRKVEERPVCCLCEERRLKA